jgi:hypothetical protein
MVDSQDLQMTGENEGTKRFLNGKLPSGAEPLGGVRGVGWGGSDEGS